MSLLTKGAYPQECVVSWSKFDEFSLPNKYHFHSNLNPANINENFHDHAGKVGSIFNMKNIQDYLDLNVQRNTLLFTGNLENLRKMRLKTYDLNPCHYYSVKIIA